MSQWEEIFERLKAVEASQQRLLEALLGTVDGDTRKPGLLRRVERLEFISKVAIGIVSLGAGSVITFLVSHLLVK